MGSTGLPLIGPPGLASKLWSSCTPPVNKPRHGDADDAISDMRTALDLLFDPGQVAWGVVASAIFVETLLDRDGESVYRDYRDRYRATATALGFEGYMEWAEAMP